MTLNPLYNALLAAGYIVLVATVMNLAHQVDVPENGILIPITVLSLFVLSAAVMAYLFVFQPAQLYLDGKKTEAVNLFLKTVGFFAGITVILLGILFWTAV
ncbi:hypothetical protein HYW60_02670 [Candidatus Kaiserbacteria bacterium]|nr:hypothetical protein [Candidatus Kaiserbacteria bacterium]